MLDPYWHTLTRTALRTVQLALTVAIAILYGIDLTHTTNKHAHARPEWIYADVTASLSGITCLTHLLLGTATTTATRMLLWSLWGFVLFVLWLAQVGVFGGIYVDWKGHYPGYYDDGSYGATRCVAVVVGVVRRRVNWMVVMMMRMLSEAQSKSFTEPLAMLAK
ncbi:hypothetical protein MPDQ_001467 [Monascus purpureus]|uniref:MARVEL domain-containing protein n=1 Tax=Monascus purpureus TaxID=5098 RepID=A0A507R4T3_MONPU|nr:hypothetical protein MPDQ_001467 [Monascus purpureus]BDD61693.1 hypothetical protein MAP00_006724 [Monascus purpureus]